MTSLPRPIGVGDDLALRHATPDDADAMGAFLVPTWLDAHRGQIPAELWQRRRDEWSCDVSATAWRRTLDEIDGTPGHPSTVLVAATPGGAVESIGMMTLDGSGTAVIDALYVGAGRRRSGVGRIVLAELAAIAAGDGATSIEVEVLAANTPAREFYERAGGLLAGDRLAHDDGVAIAAVIYRWSEMTGVLQGARP